MSDNRTNLDSTMSTPAPNRPEGLSSDPEAPPTSSKTVAGVAETAAYVEGGN